jgi:hypothetical protein
LVLRLCFFSTAFCFCVVSSSDEEPEEDVYDDVVETSESERASSSEEISEWGTTKRTVFISSSRGKRYATRLGGGKKRRVLPLADRDARRGRDGMGELRRIPRTPRGSVYGWSWAREV